MPDADGTVAAIQEGLGPYVKSREQVNYIRRILAAHLGDCAQGGPIKSALALASGRDADGTVKIDPTTPDGVYKEYLAALQENIAARKEFEALRHYEIPELGAGDSRAPPAGASPPMAAGLHERIALLKLHQKRDGLYAVQETLDTLLEQPAADAEFLDTDRIFQGTPPLPAVPKDVINTMVIEQSTSALDIPGQVNHLEKVVLRAKLLLRQEEQQLHEAKQRLRRMSASQPPSQAAKLMALSATRDDLINWIETELGKAAPETQSEVDGDEQGKGLGKADPATVQAKLGIIKEKYASYVSARKELLEMVSSDTNHPPPPSRSKRASKRASYVAPPRPPMDHLVAPYLASLVEASAKHKAMVAYRTHISSLLNKTGHDIGRRISHLSDESQLLATFPPMDSPRARSGAEGTSQMDTAAQVKPWVDASDAAKMATLELVAETVENGQIALEGLMNTLGGIGKLTGQDVLAEEKTGEEDMWMGADTPKARRHTRKGSKAQPPPSNDPWTKVRGNLGLLGQEM